MICKIKKLIRKIRYNRAIRNGNADSHRLESNSEEDSDQIKNNLNIFAKGSLVTSALLVKLKDDVIMSRIQKQKMME